MPHAGQLVTVEVEDTTLRMLDERGTILSTVPRLTGREVKRRGPTATRTVMEAQELLPLN